jgi:hypothetical protein
MAKEYGIQKQGARGNVLGNTIGTAWEHIGNF